MTCQCNVHSIDHKPCECPSQAKVKVRRKMGSQFMELWVCDACTMSRMDTILEDLRDDRD